MSRYAFLATDGPVALFEYHGARHLVDGLESLDEFRPATSCFYSNSGPRVEEMEGVFAEGMTVCVEAYGGEVGRREGVRPEEQVLITGTGAERLSSYAYELQFL